MLLRHVSQSISSTFTLRTNILAKLFTVSQHALTKPLPPRPVINEADIEEAFLKGSGPGGQKIVGRPDPADKVLADRPRDTEQNILRRSIETPAHRPGRQITRNTLPITEQEDC